LNRCLGTLTADAAGQLHVLGHHGDALGVDGAQVGVLEKTNEVGLAGFLKSHDGGGLEAEIGLEILGNLTHETLEGRAADQKLGGLLVLADLAKGDSAGAEAGLLAGLSFLTSLRGQLLARGFGAGALAGGLLGACHDEIRLNDSK
jgi:hypothetical protein